jgi:hypothetical protein
MHRSCDFCGKTYEAQRSSSRFCGSSCRARMSMGEAPTSPAARVTVIPVDGDAPEEPGAVEAATRKALEDAGKVETPLGQAALLLARDLDVSSPGATAAKASCVKQLAATLEAITAGAKQAEDPLEKLRKERESKRAAG